MLTIPLHGVRARLSYSHLSKGFTRDGEFVLSELPV